MNKFLAFLLAVLLCQTGFAQPGEKQVPDKLVVLTFDDATASQYSVVAPLLKQYGFGATFFVCEFPPNFSDSSKYMNWRQIRELDKMGFEVANHTRTHPPVGKLSRENFLDELKYIEAKCDSLDIAKPTTFAYPGYDLSLSVIELLKETGYKFARAGGSRPYDPLIDHPLLIPSWAMNSENKKEIMKALKKARDGKIVVLTIHGVPDSEHPWVNTPPELFREYLRYMSDQHFKVIAFRDLGSYVDTEEAMQKLVPDLTKKLSN
jgi:peptidoglycan-N-acetylglucosamine deacetylase